MSKVHRSNQVRKQTTKGIASPKGEPVPTKTRGSRGNRTPSKPEVRKAQADSGPGRRHLAYAPGSDDERNQRWLVECMERAGIEKPTAFVSKDGVWTIRNGRQVLGRIKPDVVVAREEKELRIGYLHGVIKVPLVLSRPDKHRIAAAGGIEHVQLTSEEQTAKALDDQLWLLGMACGAVSRGIVERMIAVAATGSGRTFSLKENKPAIVTVDEKGKWSIFKQTAMRGWFQPLLDEWNRQRIAKDPKAPVVGIGSGVRDCILQELAANYDKWRANRHKDGPPWPTAMTFPVHKQRFDLKLDRAGAFIEFSLAPKDETTGRAAWQTVRLQATHGHPWSVLRKLCGQESEYRLGQVRICKPKKGRTFGKRWILEIPYTYPPPKRASVDHNKVLCVRRVLSGLLIMMSEDGEYRTVCASRQDVGTASAVVGGRASRLDAPNGLIAHKLGIQAQLKSLGNHAKLGFPSKRGHGKNKRGQVRRIIGDRERRFVDTWGWQAANMVCDTALALGCGRILIEDFSASSPPDAGEATWLDRQLTRLFRRFPWCEVGEKIKQVALKRGLVVEEESTHYNVAECPDCGSREVVFNRHTRTWGCKSCQLEWDIDRVAVWNMLKKHSVDVSLVFRKKADDLKRFKQQAQQLRDAAE